MKELDLRFATRKSTTTQPTASLHNAHLTRKPAASVCCRKHHTPGDRVSVSWANCAWVSLSRPVAMEPGPRIYSGAASALDHCTVWEAAHITFN